MNAAELKITPTAITATVMASTTYTNAMAGKANTSDLGNLTSRVDAAELKITPTAIVSTVTQSSTYTTTLAGKASTGEVSNLATRVSTAEQKITADAITLTVRSSVAYSNDLASKVSTANYTGNDIVSKINLTSTTASIDANKVNITGFVTFSNLSTSGQTTINGGNISGGTLNFRNFTCTGTMRLTDASGATISFSSGTNNGGVGSNSTRGMTISSSDTILLWTTTGGLITLQGPTTITGALTAPNVVYTASSGAEKIADIKWVSSYVQVGTTSGAKGITVWDSDRRLKTNIKNSTINASNKLSQAVLRSFNWLKDGRLEQCGFVAQEIEAVFGEEFVLKVKQADGSVNYQIKEYPFIPLLVKAFQESNEKIMRLEHEVAILKSKGETIC